MQNRFNKTLFSFFPEFTGGHGRILDALKSENYPVDANGACYGLAFTWIHAELIGELDKFDERLYFISQTPDISQTLQNTRNNQLKIISDANLAAQSLTEAKFKKSRCDFDANELKQFNAHKRRLIDENSHVSYKILEIGTFLQSVALCQHSSKYHDWFEKGKDPRSQMGELSLASVMSQKLESLHGIMNVGGFSDYYDRNKLKIYLQELRNFLKSAGRRPLPVLLVNINHAIVISYDFINDRWKFFNANLMPTRYLNDDDLVSAIFLSFQSTECVAFSTSTYSCGEDALSLMLLVDLWIKKIKSIPSQNKIKSILDNYIQLGICLYLSARDNLVQDVKSILLDEKDIISLFSFDVPPLYIAAQNGHSEVVELLLTTEGMDPNQFRSSDDRTALHAAAINGHVDVVKQLVKNDKTDLNRAGHKGETPLYLACEWGHVDVVKALLSNDKTDPNKSAQDGATPLFIACQLGFIDIAELLLSNKKTDPNQAMLDGSTPLYYASSRNLIKIVKLLLENEITDPNISSYQNRLTPLHAASELGYIDIINALLVRGIDPNKTTQSGRTPLHCAVSNGQVESIRLLICQSNIDLNKVNSDGNSALLAATKKDDIKIVELLLSKPSIDIRSSLHWASQNGQCNIVSVLLQYDCSIINEALSLASVSVLSDHAKEIDKYDEFWSLLRNKLDQSIPKYLTGFNALTLAIFFGHAQVVEELLSKGAVYKNVENKITPLELAETMGSVDIRNLLKKTEMVTSSNSVFKLFDSNNERIDFDLIQPIITNKYTYI